MMEARCVMHLHQVHVTNQNSGSHPELFSEPQPLQMKAEQTLQNVADTFACAEVLKIDGARPCCLHGAMLSVKYPSFNYPSFEIPVFMAEVVTSHQEDSKLSVIAMDCGNDEVLPRTVWVFVCKEVDVPSALAGLSLQGVVRTDLSAVFTCSKKVGSGAFSQVFMGHLSTCGHDQAVVAKQITSKCKWVDVKRECRTLLQAQECKHIMKFMGVYRDPIHNSVAMLSEYIETGDLESLLLRTGTALFEPRVMIIGEGILKALAHLQSLEVVHRDVKAENILVAPHFQSKLCDFGLACFLTDERSMSKRCGSPGYVAPEILLEQGKTCITCKVDVFSLGVVIAQMLSGKHPFMGSSLASTMKRNIRCKVDYTRPSWMLVSTEAAAFTQALLQPHFGHRPSAVEAMKLSWFEKEQYLLETDLAMLRKKLADAMLEEKASQECMQAAEVREHENAESCMRNIGNMKWKEHVLHECTVTPKMLVRSSSKQSTGVSKACTSLTPSNCLSPNSNGCPEHRRSSWESGSEDEESTERARMVCRTSKDRPIPVIREDDEVCDGVQTKPSKKSLWNRFSRLRQKLIKTIASKERNDSENWSVIVVDPSQVHHSVSTSRQTSHGTGAYRSRTADPCKSRKVSLWRKMSERVSNQQYVARVPDQMQTEGKHPTFSVE
eukprot:gnl/MRDRNA2_/MRDRNA2_77870_c0_seq3.p1 gnl/MRDRNA2_/MRDRNA2_77870_c0~~gnl/MRDRNA2_/MRDRNA2_77870_c0_seq3.p1  ORF type:complete len:665 (+),score=125.78 gnl/MRDRNA2_/MRDRNA2_77870_c0_seq3:57-2051(+)